MVANNDSVIRYFESPLQTKILIFIRFVSKATYKKWSFNESSSRTSQVRSLLKTITKNQRKHIKLNCDGCEQGDEFCNCTLNQIAVENTFQVFVILESKINSATEWCPQTTLRSDFFVCDEEGTRNISAKLMCDGFYDCPDSKADESPIVCNSQLIRILSFTLNMSIYFVAFASAAFLVCSRIQKHLRSLTVENMLTEEQKRKISKALAQISNLMTDPSPENEEKASKAIRKMPKLAKLNLIKVSHSIEVRVAEAAENIFEPTIERLFSNINEIKKKELFSLIKDSNCLPTKVKLDILESFEPKGWVKRTCQDLKKKCGESTKITLVMIQGVLSATIGLLLIPLPEIKDLITIISLKIFHQDVIQGRTELIDNVPLDDFVIILSVIFGLTLILKLFIARSCSVSSTSWRHWIPFVPDIEIALRTIQEVIKRHKINSLMQFTIENLEDNDEAETEWMKIVTMAHEVEEINLNIEHLGAKKREVKVVSCFGDILQGCILMVLLLRTDLRIRSLLQFSSVCRKIGMDPRKGGAAGGATIK